MDNNEAKELLMKRRLAVALYAQSNDVQSTKAFAERNGLAFDKEQIFSDLERLFDVDTADSLRGWWDEKRQAAFDQKLMQLINEEEQKFLREQSESTAVASHISDVTNSAGKLLRDVLARLNNAIDTIKIKHTVQELMISMTPMQLSYGSDFRGKGGSDGNAADSSHRTSRPKIDPSLHIEDDSLTIWLRLRTKGLALPHAKEAISLFVDGAHYSNFVFHRSGDDMISIEAMIDSDSLAKLSEKDFNLYYTADLKEISIVVGANPNELSQTDTNN